MSGIVHQYINDQPVTAANPVPVRSVAAGSAYTTAVALTSPPANLTAGANTALTFASAVYVVTVENNSGEDKRVKFPSPAGAGSSLLPDGASYTYSAGSDFAAAGVTSLGIYGASATPLNDDTQAVGILVTGRA